MNIAKAAAWLMILGAVVFIATTAINRTAGNVAGNL